MLCFISDMILPSFIPLNEAAIKPDTSCAFYTIQVAEAKALDDLKLESASQLKRIETHIRRHTRFRLYHWRRNRVKSGLKNIRINIIEVNLRLEKE